MDLSAGKIKIVKKIKRIEIGRDRARQYETLSQVFRFDENVMANNNN